ncbi:hypothetical protein LY76DRAFT_645183 [Colletotrichum caudatum]|nr:hypothetical protein LY76DRAFT_645183 [Colletotrichum caudatum]
MRPNEDQMVEVTHCAELGAVRRESKIPPWILHPDLFKATGSQHSWKDEFAQHVVARVMWVVGLGLERTMRTPLELPDGIMSYPAANMKPFKYIIEEFTFPRKVCRVLF